MESTHASLLVRIRNRGDAQAWAAFDEIYRPLLHRYAMSRGLSADDSEDIVQHTMGVITEHIGAFDYDPERGRFRSWLRTIVNNRIRTAMRKRRPVSMSGDAIEHLAPDDEGRAEFERIWDQEHLWHCLRRLRAEVEQRTFEVFRMHAIEGRDADIVCAEYSLSKANLHQIKSRCARRLSALMRELLGDDSDGSA